MLGHQAHQDALQVMGTCTKNVCEAESGNKSQLTKAVLEKYYWRRSLKCGSNKLDREPFSFGNRTDIVGGVEAGKPILFEPQ